MHIHAEDIDIIITCDGWARLSCPAIQLERQEPVLPKPGMRGLDSRPDGRDEADASAPVQPAQNTTLETESRRNTRPQDSQNFISNVLAAGAVLLAAAACLFALFMQGTF